MMVTGSQNKKWFVVMIAVIVCLAVAYPAHADWRQRQKIIASDGAAGDGFGQSVSISGDLAIVGASDDDDNGYNSGSAFIFKWDGASWMEQQKLTASDGAAGDDFGWSVSISGDLAIVGAGFDDDNGTESGSAYIFKWDGASWVEQQKLTALDGATWDLFGYSVSITRGGAGAGSGDLAIVGAMYDDDNGDNSGSAYIFKWDGASWVEQKKLTASDGAHDDKFGHSVSISSDLVIVGAYWDDDNARDSGSAYIFKWDGASWMEQQKLIAWDGAANDHFGWSVSITSTAAGAGSEDLAIVGAAYDNDIEDSSGSAYIFKWDGSSWIEQQKLTASDAARNDFFGWSVSISGDLAIVGAPYDDDYGRDSGSAYMFRWDGFSWVEQQKLTASDGAAGDQFGWSVSITSAAAGVGSGDLAIVGAHYGDGNGGNSGSAYIFVPVVTGVLTLLSPNGGEELVAGSTYDITWDTNGVVSNVFIEYSANNSVAWTAIDTAANIGSYPWLVPDVNSEQCLVWISDSSYPAAGDVSDDVFRIYVCTLAFDLNHDCFLDFLDFSLLASEWLQCGDPSDPDCVP